MFQKITLLGLIHQFIKVILSNKDDWKRKKGDSKHNGSRPPMGYSYSGLTGGIKTKVLQNFVPFLCLL